MQEVWKKKLYSKKKGAKLTLHK
uniref:Uncharacterized protein n=1 Tax=Rhizophora mucronata TaxID=61149 RepID=A0A2P2QT74_RHIMU